MQIFRSRVPLVLLALAGVTGACGDNKNGASPGPDGPLPPDAAVDAPDASPDAPPDAPTTNACLAPFTLVPDASAEAAARAELAALAPTATMTWSESRGTLRSVSGLVITLPECVGSINVYDKLIEVVTRSPALFQIDPREWSIGQLTCDEVLKTGYHLVPMYRIAYGPYELHTDVFAAATTQVDGQVILRSFSGTYIPKPSTEMIERLASCPDQPDAAITGAAGTQPFTYHTFAPPPAPICSIDGEGTYKLSDADQVTLQPSSLLWEESEAITMRRERMAIVEVATANQSSELVNSTANCDLDGTPHIGWTRMFNAVTGEIMYDRDTPDPYCTVCLDH